MPYGAESSQLTPRVLTEYQLIRGAENVITCPVYDGADLVAPSASDTVSIYADTDTDGSPSIVDGATLTSVSGDVASYTVTAGSLPSTLAFADRWRVVWSLTLNGTGHTFRFSAALVCYPLFPVVTDADIYGRINQLNPAVKQPLTSRGTFRPERDDAWTTIYNRISNEGNRPNLIMEPTALREAHMALVLANVFRALAITNYEAYSQVAADFREEYRDAWRALRFRYASSDDGTAQQGRRNVRPSVWLTSRG